MDVVILKVLCRNLSNFKDGTLDIDFIAEKKVFSHEITDNTVEQLFGSACKFNVLAFAGINATGKTTLLNILSDVLRTFVGNNSLNRKMALAEYFEETLELETYYYHKQKMCIYKLVSFIRKEHETGELLFFDEVLYEKRVLAQTNKKNLFAFCHEDIVLQRNLLKDSFLKAEDSIFSSVMNQYGVLHSSVINMCGTTNFNYLYSFAPDLLIQFAQYLDPSIEYLKTTDAPEGSDNFTTFEIKFRNFEQPVVVEQLNLDKYLSSGTIKGINCLSNIEKVFKSGGYFLIDEIENHLNKTIVINIISLFAGALNKKGATLLFSTHYSEILDCIDRSDAIYLLKKERWIEVNKFSAVALSKDRRDKKRSDLILSGALDSAPSYEAYEKLTDGLSCQLWTEG